MEIIGIAKDGCYDILYEDLKLHLFLHVFHHYRL